MWRFKKKLFGQVDTIQSNTIIRQSSSVQLQDTGTGLLVSGNTQIGRVTSNLMVLFSCKNDDITIGFPGPLEEEIGKQMFLMHYEYQNWSAVHSNYD